MIESCFSGLFVCLFIVLFSIQSDILRPKFGESRPFSDNVIVEMFDVEATFSMCFLFASFILHSFPAFFQIEWGFFSI